MAHIFTQEGLDVTKRVHTGMTKIVWTKQQAEHQTRLVGYFYPIFDKDERHIGYAIAK